MKNFLFSETFDTVRLFRIPIDVAGDFQIVLFSLNFFSMNYFGKLFVEIRRIFDFDWKVSRAWLVGIPMNIILLPPKPFTHKLKTPHIVQMSSKSNFKLKDYLSDDGKLDLSILNLKTVPNVNEIVRSIFFHGLCDSSSIFS